MNTDTYVLLCIFQNMSNYFRMKNMNSFQILKVQPQGAA